MLDNDAKTEFWESAFVEKQEMWGHEPSSSAFIALDHFKETGARSVLVPGYGYGRNAHVFVENDMEVTGIEISRTAIELARKHKGDTVHVYHGSVVDMPFDTKKYDGIFCYALIHLLDAAERRKLIADCYEQLADNGCMVFVAISKKSPTYGQGRYIEQDRYEIFEGVKMYFYDEASIEQEFGPYGLERLTEITENFPFYLITCKKISQ